MVKENRKTSCRLHPCLYGSRHTSLASLYINETFGEFLLLPLLKKIFVLRLNWSNLFKNFLLSTISIKTNSIITPWQPKQYALFVTTRQFEKFAIRNTSDVLPVFAHVLCWDNAVWVFWDYYKSVTRFLTLSAL